MFAKLQGKRIKADYKGEKKVHVIKQYNYTQLLQCLQEGFDIPQTTPVEFKYIDSSRDLIRIETEEEFISAMDAGVTKYDLVLKEEKPTISAIEKMSKMETSQPIEEKVETAVQASPSIKGQYKLNPRVLEEMFKKLMSTEACALEIEDIVKNNRKTLLSENYKLEDYGDVLRTIEKQVEDALENNVFLVDIGCDEEFDAQVIPKSVAQVEQPIAVKAKRITSSTDLDNIPMDQSVSEAQVGINNKLK